MMLTKKILKDTPELGYGDNLSMEEQTVTAKFFDPTGSFTWYLMEMRIELMALLLLTWYQMVSSVHLA